MSTRRSLSQCSTEEISVLFLISSMVQQLPSDLIEYIPALGEMRRKYFNLRGGQRGEHNPSGASLAHNHQPRVTDRWK